MTKIKLPATTALTILLGLLIISCSSNQNFRPKVNSIDEVVQKLSTKPYPADLYSETIKIMSRDQKFTTYVLEELKKKLYEAPLSDKPVIAANIFTLEEMLTKIISKKMEDRGLGWLTVEYMMEHPLYTTSQPNMQLYMLISQDRSLHSDLSYVLEYYLARSQNAADLYYAEKNSKYLKSISFPDQGQTDAEVKAGQLSYRHGSFYFGIKSQINGSIVDISFILANNSASAAYISLDNPMLVIDKVIPPDNLYQNSPSEKRYFEAGAIKQIDYSFSTTQRLDAGNTKFSIRLNGQNYLLSVR